MNRPNRKHFGLAGRSVGAMFCSALIFIILLSLAATASASTEHALDEGLSRSGLSDPCATATDRHGDLYVALAGGGTATSGRVNVYGPTGTLFTSITGFQIIEESCSIAVNDEGVIYVLQHFPFENASGGQSEDRVAVYKPQGGVFPPTSGMTYQGPTILPVEITKKEDPNAEEVKGFSVTVDPQTNAVFVSMRGGFKGVPSGLFEYQSAAAGSAFVRKITEPFPERGYFRGIAVSSAKGEILAYATAPHSGGGAPDNHIVGVSIATGLKTFDLDGSTTPSGSFSRQQGANISVGVEQLTGNFYVNDATEHRVVDIFGPNGASPSEPPAYRSCIGNPVSCKPVFPTLESSIFGTGIAVDSPVVAGEPGYDSPNEEEVYLTSGKASGAHVYAFAPVESHAPEITETKGAQISDTRATLQAGINPRGSSTSYVFEYVSNAAFQETAFTTATTVPSPPGNAGNGINPVLASVEVTGLQPSTTYHLRARAVSECEPGSECETVGEEVTFSTYPLPSGLPEGRAYELVTPGRTGGRTPTQSPFGAQHFALSIFPASFASNDGGRLVFGTEGGGLPGFEGGNGFYESFESVRGPDGWTTRGTSPNGEQGEVAYPGGFEIEQSFSTWFIKSGSLAAGGEFEYLRHPDGAFELVGEGDLTTDPAAAIKAVTPGGGRIFLSMKKLESNGPPNGSQGVYFRSPEGPTLVVSLLPNGEPASSSAFRGSSTSGSVIVFQDASGTLYERVDNAATHQVSPAGAVFLAVSSDGRWILYQSGGEIFAFDGETETASPSNSGSGATVVNVSADGSHTYFVSKAVLTGSEQNNFGAAAQAGKENLYVWDRVASTLRFVATVLPVDVEGSKDPTRKPIGGLGLWALDASTPEVALGPANETSRTTPNGNVIVFESRADITPPYKAGGHIEIYRYEASSATLACVSCNPTGAQATGNAQLQSHYALDLEVFAPIRALSNISNLTTDGQRVFFQSADRLASGDTNTTVDVYEWVNDGAGSCAQAAGCIYLISSGQSTQPNYLYAMTPDGHDVFFETTDQLVGRDVEPTPSIYDARVGGGFIEPTSQPLCSGSTCQGQGSGVPPGTSPGTETMDGPRNSPPTKQCPKNKHRVKRNGKSACVKKQPKSKKNKNSAHHGHASGQHRTEGKGR